MVGSSPRSKSEPKRVQILGDEADYLNRVEIDFLQMDDLTEALKVSASNESSCNGRRVSAIWVRHVHSIEPKKVHHALNIKGDCRASR